MNRRTTIITASALGALAVVLGASGAHGLQETLATRGTTHTFELANRYHFFHVLALLATGILMSQFSSSRLKYAAFFFVAGIICFSGSLYAMSFVHSRALGPVTPVGGLFFIAGWTTLAWGALSDRDKK